MGALDGKVAIVTGAGRGIGRSVALLLAEEGARVIVNDTGGELDGTGGDSRLAHDVARLIEDRGGEAIPNTSSVVDPHAAEEMVRLAVDTYGQLDIVVNAAGILRDRMIFNMTRSEWDEVLAVHLGGHFNLIRPASAVMREQRSGRIINFSASSGTIGKAGHVNYGAAKAAISGLTRVVARDLGRYGVTCNAISPRARTRMTEFLMEPEPEWTPDAIAPMVAYLASDHAGDVNGQHFYVGAATIALAEEPVPGRTIFSDAGWEYGQLDRAVHQHLLRDMANPAPPSASFVPGEPPQDSRRPLEGRAYLVTGAGRGIGQAIARAISAMGGAVVVNDAGVALDGSGGDPAPALETAQGIVAAGGRAVANIASVASEAGGREMVRQCIDEFGRLDGVVHAAGIVRDRMIFNMTQGEWDDVIGVHLNGFFNVVQPASVEMRQARGGRILALSSIAGTVGNAGQANYGAAKAGIVGAIRCAARDLGRHGITANAICPIAATRMMAGTFEKNLESLPLPENIAPMSTYLLTDRAWNVNGKVFYVSGGRVSLALEEAPGPSITKTGLWTVETLRDAVPGLLIGVRNPAPAEARPLSSRMMRMPAVRPTPFPAPC